MNCICNSIREIKRVFTGLLFLYCSCSGDLYLIGDPQNELPCIETEITIIPSAPEVLILMDRSNSMYYNGFWEPTKDAIVNMVKEYESKVMFGIAIFPGPMCTPEIGDFDCTGAVYPDIQIDFFTGSSIESFLNSVITCGGTPVAESLINMGNYLESRPFENPKTILLATDGAPNCNNFLDGNLCRCTCPSPDLCSLCPELPSNCLDDVRTYEALDNLRMKGYRTWIVGLSDAAVEWGDVLMEMAQHGGTENFFAAEDPRQIQDIFNTIMATVSRCSFHLLESEITNRDLINLYIDSSFVPLDPENSSGWNWSGYSSIQFFGEFCDLIASGDIQKVKATSGCPTITR